MFARRSVDSIRAVTMSGNRTVSGASFRAANFLRKNLSSRAIKFILSLYFIGRVPFLRDFFVCYVKTIDPEQVNIGEKINTESKDELYLTQDDFRYLSSYKNYFGKNIKKDRLIIERSFVSFTVPKCLVLPRALVPVHLPTKRLVLPSFKELSRNLVSVGRYRKRRSLGATAYSMLSTPRGAGHYFHFFFDQLLVLLAGHPKWKIEGRIHLLIRANTPTFQQPALDYIADNFAQVRFETVGADEAIECEKLVVTYSYYEKPIDIFCFKEKLKEIKEIYYSHYKIGERKKFRLIYISRSNQKTRRIVNEHEVISVLAAYGFETVNPEDLAHSQQVALFSEASVVIGTTGAAFTNLLFCKPGCRVIEIRPSNLNYPLYIGLCKQMGLQHRFFEGSAMNVDREFLVDVGALGPLVADVMKSVQN